LPTDYDSAFRAMLADPANLDLTFRFAELALAADDLEGAISAFERLLIFNPDLPRIRYELGLLYMRLGSYQIAKGYFEDVTRAADVPAEVQAATRANLAEIEKRLSATSFGF
jgi:tetratricopeptide (TPR) repeat protein